MAIHFWYLMKICIYYFVMVEGLNDLYVLYRFQILKQYLI